MILSIVYGHVEAASELLQRLPPREISLAKSPSSIGIQCDISDYEMTSGSQLGSPEALESPPGSPPGLTQSTKSTSFGMFPSRSAVDAKFGDTTNLRQAMKIESTSYYEIGQMIDIINSLWTWRQVEDWRFALAADDSGEEELADARQETTETLDFLKQSMSLLEDDFLTTPALGTESPGMQRDPQSAS